MKVYAPIKIYFYWADHENEQLIRYRYCINFVNLLWKNYVLLCICPEFSCLLPFKLAMKLFI